MRRKDREVLGDENIAKIIEQCTTCHIAMVDDADAGMPYVIPMSFGYSLMDGVLELYFHCAHVGKKLDCIRKNPNVAFSMCVENRIDIHEDVYCKSGRFYASVVGQGKAEIIEDSASRRRTAIRSCSATFWFRAVYARRAAQVRIHARTGRRRDRIQDNKHEFYRESEIGIVVPRNSRVLRIAFCKKGRSLPTVPINCFNNCFL